MRRIIGSIAAALALVAAIAVMAASQNAGGVNRSMGDGGGDVSASLGSPQSDYATVTSMMGDWESDWFEDFEQGDGLDDDSGVATALRTASTWRALGTYNGGEVISAE